MSGAPGWVLELDGARAAEGEAQLDLAIAPGELVLVQAQQPRQMAALTDLCCGVAPAREGHVRVLGRDWAMLRPAEERLLRARIGVVCADGGWPPQLPVGESILLPALFHATAARAALEERAAELCRRFGLPGLPLGRPRELNEAELARAACARAFLMRPDLLILESPLLGGVVEDLRLPLLDAIAAAREAGCLWMTTSLSVWTDRAMPAARRFRLGVHGLERVRRLAA